MGDCNLNIGLGKLFIIKFNNFSIILVILSDSCLDVPVDFRMQFDYALTQLVVLEQEGRFFHTLDLYYYGLFDVKIFGILLEE